MMSPRWTRQNPEAARFAKFLLVGGLNTLVSYFLFAGFTLLGARPAVAALGATILSVLFNFQSFGKLVFATPGYRILPRFLLAYVVLYALNVILLRVGASFALAPLLAQAIIVPFLAVLSFVMMRRFVFGAVKRQTGVLSQ